MPLFIYDQATSHSLEKKKNYTSVFIKSHIGLSALFCPFIVTLSSVLFTVSNDFNFTTLYEYVKDTLTCTFFVAFIIASCQNPT